MFDFSKKFHLVFFVTLFLTYAPVTFAQSEMFPFAGTEVDVMSFSDQEIPQEGDIAGAYVNDAGKASVFMKDLNGDGALDYLIRDNPDFCGTGGCGYDLFDGKTKKNIGSFWGRPLLILDQTFNDYPLIQAYSHSSAQSGTLSAWAFERDAYKKVSGVGLSGEAVEALFEKIGKSFKKPGN